jgi:ribose 5-phosphate isomerase RpiB
VKGTAAWEQWTILIENDDAGYNCKQKIFKHLTKGQGTLAKRYGKFAFPI